MVKNVFTLSVSILLFLALSAFIASVIDTMAGGGGLINVPVLLGVGFDPVTALGTNRLQSAIGELSATLHFARRGRVNYKVILIYLLYTAVGAIVGALILQLINQKILEKMIPFLLLFVLIYYLYPKKMLQHHDGVRLQRLRFLGPVVGFYNGFFGPGTGSIWFVVLVKIVRVDIKAATMYAKPLNFIGNISSLVVFLFFGKINFLAAAVMGCGSFLGGKVGAHMVLYRDVKLLKGVIITMMVLSTISAFWKIGL